MVAQERRDFPVDKRFTGHWVLEKIELQESLANNPKQVTKTEHSLESLKSIQSLSPLTIIGMNFPQEAESERNLELIFENMKNPVMEFGEDFFFFSERRTAEQIGDRYNFRFLSPDKILLTGPAIFYLNDKKMPVKGEILTYLKRQP